RRHAHTTTARAAERRRRVPNGHSGNDTILGRTLPGSSTRSVPADPRTASRLSRPGPEAVPGKAPSPRMALGLSARLAQLRPSTRRGEYGDPRPRALRRGTVPTGD